MKKLLWLISPIFLVMMSCNNDDLTTSEFVAGEVFTDSNIRVVSVDTMTVEVSTIKFDSIITSQSDRILIGQYSDPVFGMVKSSNYMGMLPNSYTIASEAVYDSIVLFLKYDQYYYNDTLQTNTIHVKRLTANFNPDENDSFYNTSKVTYDEKNLGSITYLPRPLSTDSLGIKLVDNLGLEFFNNLQNKIISNNAEFTAKFKGLSMQPGEDDNGSVIGFSKGSASCYMRLYFSTSEADDRVQTYIDFILNTTDTPNPFFNQISAVEPIDYIKTLTDIEVNLNSLDSGNQSFIQSGIGIATRIQFPHIKTINNLNGQGTLLDAVLKIKPATGSYSDNLPIRNNLAVFLVDKNNAIIEQLYNSSGTGIYATLNRENEEYNDIYYEIPLSSYIEKLLLAERDTHEALILFPTDYTTTVDRFILNGSHNTNYKTTLELTYAIYDENN
tara:strand:+ start:50156 stop:51484 length:1329 start_codon:yes stop_codon:yes gene_type:complete